MWSSFGIGEKPGETVAFVGETGSGKSTIAKLLTRFYDPDRGSVRIDGYDLRDVSITSLRRQLGVVPQEPFLFAGVVRDNVAFARPDATDDELHDALAAVGIDDVIDRLGGLDAAVHERGASLSAGERQLLALARAFVARPRVLILDEATSNLDLHSETRIERALDVVLEGARELPPEKSAVGTIASASGVEGLGVACPPLACPGGVPLDIPRPLPRARDANASDG